MRKTHRKFLFLVPIVILAVGALVMLRRHPPLADTAANRNAVYSAVFQKMMARRERPYTGLSVGRKDPDPAVMNQFRKNIGVVVGSRITVGPSGSFVDKKTGGDAEAFSVSPDSLRWRGPGLVSIDALSHGSYSDGYLGTYFLRRKEHSWAVLSYRDSGVRF